MGQFLAVFAAAHKPGPQRVLMEEAVAKFSSRQQRLIKGQLGYAAPTPTKWRASEAHELVSNQQVKKKELKKAAADVPIELDFEAVGRVVERCASSFPTCMDTFNTCRFSRAGLSSTIVL